MVAQGSHHWAADYFTQAATSFEAGGEHIKAVAMHLSAAGSYKVVAGKWEAQGNHYHAAQRYSDAANAYESAVEYPRAVLAYESARIQYLAQEDHTMAETMQAAVDRLRSFLPASIDHTPMAVGRIPKPHKHSLVSHYWPTTLSLAFICLAMLSYALYQLYGFPLIPFHWSYLAIVGLTLYWVYYVIMA